MQKASRSIGFVSLGCPKATYDSERIMTQLRAEGYQFVGDYNSADLVIVNTCGFIDAAVEESLEVIGDALNENGKVIVTGCLGAKNGMVESVHPAVLAVTGPDSLLEVMANVHQHLPPEHDPYIDLIPPGGVKLTPRHYAYIKIAEGCNQTCSFCIIPSMRGKLQSRPIGDILQEATKLVESGVQELLVVAQDTAAYGVDVKYQTGFYQGRPLKTRIEILAEELGQLGAWVRMHYIYPYPHVDKLIALMAEGKILPYLDIPLQHASPSILKAMRRPANQENMLRRIEKWRELVPGLTLRSTFIVGFPGESEQDFLQLLDFLQQAQLDRVGAFSYSAVTGAAANELDGQISEQEKEDRLEALMLQQSAISADRLQRRIGEITPVVIDDFHDGEAICRSYAEAPEIDGVVWVEDSAGLEIGDVIDVEIVSTDEHDLFARHIQHPHLS